MMVALSSLSVVLIFSFCGYISTELQKRKLVHTSWGVSESLWVLKKKVDPESLIQIFFLCRLNRHSLNGHFKSTTILFVVNPLVQYFMRMAFLYLQP